MVENEVDGLCESNGSRLVGYMTLLHAFKEKVGDAFDSLAEGLATLRSECVKVETHPPEEETLLAWIGEGAL